MKIAINQPYFFPYLGYFSLIKNTDQFIILDVVQFVPQSWIRRNRILKADNGWRYILVPVNKAPREALIKDITICNTTNWKMEILNQMSVYKRIAPNYQDVFDLVNNIFESEYNHISELCQVSLKAVCNYLGIETEIINFVELDISIQTPESTDEWALNICKAMKNVDEYWNLPNGISFYDKTKYEAAGVTIKFPRNRLRSYNQERSVFEPGLSIIDVMMFNSKKEIYEMLDDFELL